MDFANVTGEPDSAWLSAGIAETVTGDLRALGRFRVVDRWRVMEAARRTGGSLQEVAAALGTRLARRRQLPAQRRSDPHHGSRRRRRQRRSAGRRQGRRAASSDIFELQDRVVAQFSKELGVPPTPARLPARRETPSLEAYRAFRKAGCGSKRSTCARCRGRSRTSSARSPSIRATRSPTPGSPARELASYETTRSDNEPAQDAARSRDRARAAGRRRSTTRSPKRTRRSRSSSSARGTPTRPSRRRGAPWRSSPRNWRHFFRLGHALVGRRAAARRGEHARALPRFRVRPLSDGDGPRRARPSRLKRKRCSARAPRCRIGRSVAASRYPALGLHWLLGLVRLAQDDVEEALEEFERERALARTAPALRPRIRDARRARHGARRCCARRRAGEAIDRFQRALGALSGSRAVAPRSRARPSGQSDRPLRPRRAMDRVERP